LGFNKTVSSFAELDIVIQKFVDDIFTSVDKTINQSGKEGKGHLRSFLERSAKWKGTLVNSVDYKWQGRLRSKILVTAPESIFINEGVRPHRVYRYSRDGSPTLSASGEPFGDWLDEHGFSDKNSIVVGLKQGSPLKKPGLQFIPKTAVYISQIMPVLLEKNIKQNVR
jgi:hypothetical protein